MVKPIRVVIGMAAAIASLVLASLYTGNFLNSSLLPTAGRTFGLSAIFLGIASFVLVIKLRSVIVGALLAAAGVVIIVPPTTAIFATGTITFPGPILGVISYSIILGLGISKMVTSTALKRTIRPQAV